MNIGLMFVKEPKKIDAQKNKRTDKIILENLYQKIFLQSLWHINRE